LFVPKDSSDLTKGGVLKALQVTSLQNSQPIVFHAGQADADILSADQKDLHTYGKTFNANWIPIHDTAVDGLAPFDANALAKSRGATPFKRPENGVFRPKSDFTEFYFTETGDTNAQTEAGANFGGFGGLFKFIRQPAGTTSGTLTMFYRGDLAHTGLDNIAFASADEVVAVEDAGDGLHGQRNAFDSAYVFDVGKNYGNGNLQPSRLIYVGRDTAATIDAGYSGSGFQNDGDNEITGIHVSNGDPRVTGLLGYLAPKPFVAGWRMFYTQQHGDNQTYEILPSPAAH
jgi:secreted PhoX family phosphatase